MEHRNAASKIITSIWTPEALASTVERRMIFNWFIHFDVIASMMAGHNTALGAEWTTATRQAVCDNYQSNPEELNASLEYTLCTFREMAINTSMLTAKRSQSKVTMEDFLDSCRETLKLCHEWWNSCNPKIKDGAKKFIPSAPDVDEVPCPFEPAPIWTGSRWGVNFMTLDYHALVIVLEHQISLTQNAPVEDSPVYEHATRICELVAGLAAYKHTPHGYLLSTQAALALAALWLPDLPNYRAWLRKQLAKIEQMG